MFMERMAINYESFFVNNAISRETNERVRIHLTFLEKVNR